MLASLGQCIALATHANAAIAGHRVNLDIETHPWFKWFTESRFGVGDDRNQQVAANPSEWLTWLEDAGWERAYFFVEPYDGKIDTLARVGSSGGVHWAPVTANSSMQLIWHERPTYDKDKNPAKPWSMWRGGFRVMPNQSSLTATTKEAAHDLHNALGRMIEFAQLHRTESEASSFPAKLAGGRSQLETSGILSETMPSQNPWTPPEPVVSLFPEGLYPTESLVLVAAVHEAWILGGMGSWNDWSSKDRKINDEYARVTGDYYSAMCKCLFAACNVRL